MGATHVTAAVANPTDPERSLGGLVSRRHGRHGLLRPRQPVA